MGLNLNVIFPMFALQKKNHFKVLHYNYRIMNVLIFEISVLKPDFYERYKKFNSQIFIEFHRKYFNIIPQPATFQYYLFLFSKYKQV